MKLYWILLFLLPLNVLWAQVMSLDSVLVTIKKNNPELQMYDARVSELNSYAKGAKAWEAPQVSAGFFMTPYNPALWKGGNGMNENPGMGSFMVQGQQMIPNPVKLNASQRYMESMSAVESSSKGIAQNGLYSNARNAYYESIILKKKILLLNNQEELLKYVMRVSEIRYSYAQEKPGAVYKVKGTLAELENTRLMLESEMKSKQIYLNQLMNQNRMTKFDIDTTLTSKQYETQRIDTSLLASGRSDIRTIGNVIQVSQYKLNYEKTRAKPDFGIQYGHMFSFGGNPNLFTVMGMVSIPIAPWSSGMYRSNASGLRYQIKAYQKEREALLNEAAGELDAIRWKISNQKKQIEGYTQRILPSLEKNYKLTLLAYEQNTEDLSEVLDALEAMQMAQMELLDKKNELLLLESEYEKISERN